MSLCRFLAVNPFLAKVKEFRAISIITLTASNGNIVLIDEIDSDLAKYNWHQLPAGYFQRRITLPGKLNGGSVYLHREILSRKLERQLSRKEVTDHIDRNKLNNTRENLRLATKQNNAHNIDLPAHNTSGYFGICKVPRKYSNDTWLVNIRYLVNGKRTQHYLGYVIGKNNAAKHYDKAAAVHHGKFATFNFPDDWKWDEENQCWLRVN